MPLTSVVCPVSELVDSDTCPRPTAGGVCVDRVDAFGCLCGPMFDGELRGMLTQGGQGGPPAPLGLAIP